VTAPKVCCPWCGSEAPPELTNLNYANFVHSDPKDPKVLARNPAMCPDCFGVGGWEDWGM
jgi:hypothetical protein